MSRIRSIALSTTLLVGTLVSHGQAVKIANAGAAKSTPVATAPATATNPGSGHSLEPADLEAFFDGILPLQLERSDIAGASVLVMQNDKVLLQKGYGLADIKSKRPVDPETTIFRLASISKLFTWISVMQLEEQGKLDLDTDINHYLDFQIRPAPHSISDKPVTLRNLMTHTGGFEESVTNIILTDPRKAISLRDVLIQNQPNRIFPPGQVPAYSNYGVGLASYIVQRMSGQPFEQYVADHIFTPLGMTHSTFAQPPSKALASLPSEGYRSSTAKPSVGFEIFNPVGAGGISSTATDMGRFGQALLHGGELEGKRILRAETLTRMWTPQFQASDKLPPMCMGFYETWWNGLRWIGHQGDLIAFHSLFYVEPKQNLVLFVSYNSAGGSDQPRSEIIHFFTDRYFPGAPKVEFLKTVPDEMKGIAGTYQTTRRADSTKLAPGNLFGQRAVSVDKDGVLHLGEAKDMRGHPIKWKAIGKDLWQDQDGQARLFAIRDTHNKVVRLAVNFPGVQFQRVVWYENGTYVLSAAAASLLILFAVVAASMARAGHRFFLRRRTPPTPQPGTIWLGLGSRLAACWWFLLLVNVGGYFAMQGDDIPPPTPEWFFWFDMLNIAVGLALFLSLLAVISAFRIWFQKPLRAITKVKFTLVGVACTLLSWIAIHWNLIGPSHRI